MTIVDKEKLLSMERPLGICFITFQTEDMAYKYAIIITPVLRTADDCFTLIVYSEFLKIISIHANVG